jgi:hypothetical protein
MLSILDTIMEIYKIYIFVSYLLDIMWNQLKNYRRQVVTHFGEWKDTLRAALNQVVGHIQPMCQEFDCPDVNSSCGDEWNWHIGVLLKRDLDRT